MIPASDSSALESLARPEQGEQPGEAGAQVSPLSDGAGPAAPLLSDSERAQVSLTRLLVSSVRSRSSGPLTWI